MLHCKTVIHRFKSGCRFQKKDQKGCERFQKLAALFVLVERFRRRFLPSCSGESDEVIFLDITYVIRYVLTRGGKDDYCQSYRCEGKSL